MDSSNLKIICYTGGSCGDLVTALIDPTDAMLNTEFKTVIHAEERTKLKKPHLFNTAEEKISYVNEIGTCYRSIPSHDLDFHVLQSHNFISITIQDKSTALWAAERFKRCHRPHVWKEMQNKCSASSVSDYADILIHYSNMVKTRTSKLIKLEDIVSGNLIKTLEDIANLSISEQGRAFYQSWLDVQ